MLSQFSNPLMEDLQKSGRTVVGAKVTQMPCICTSVYKNFFVHRRQDIPAYFRKGKLNSPLDFLSNPFDSQMFNRNEESRNSYPIKLGDLTIIWSISYTDIFALSIKVTVHCRSVCTILLQIKR